MKKVQAYLASDGTLFEKEDEAIIYEYSIKNRLLIPEFLESSHNTYEKKLHKTMITNSIIAWEAYKKEKEIKV